MTEQQGLRSGSRGIGHHLPTSTIQQQLHIRVCPPFSRERGDTHKSRGATVEVRISGAQITTIRLLQSAFPGTSGPLPPCAALLLPANSNVTWPGAVSP